jgi:hypothetical protein
MSRPGIAPGPSELEGGEHSRKEPFKQLVNSYLEHLHMSARPMKNARHSSKFFKTLLQRKAFSAMFICRQVHKTVGFSHAVDLMSYFKVF